MRERHAQRRSGAGNPAALPVRLTKEQYDQLSERAQRADVPPSALAREVILASLGDADGDRAAAKLKEVLSRTLPPEDLLEVTPPRLSGKARCCKPRVVGSNPTGTRQASRPLRSRRREYH
jgi:hypothetical protein